MSSADDLPSDAALVAQTLAGECESFGLLYDRYARLIRAVVSDASSDQSTVQDLTQETFLRALRQLDTLRDADRFGPWAVGIARQVVREQFHRRRPQLLIEDQSPVADEQVPTLDDIDEVEHVLRLVAQLPEHERLAVRCFFLSEQNVEETGRLLNLSRSGTYAVLQRACTRLAQMARLGAGREAKG